MTLADRYRAQRARCPRLPASDALAEVRAQVRIEAAEERAREERLLLTLEHPEWCERFYYEP